MSFRESIYSIGSRMIQRQDDDTHLDVMTNNELQQMLDNVLQRIWLLDLENDLYERYLTRQDPQSLKTISNILERAKLTRRVTAHLMPRSSRMSFRGNLASLHDIHRSTIFSTPSGTSLFSDSKFGTSSLLTIGAHGEGSKITIEHRIVMSNKEVEEMRNNLKHFQETAKKRKEMIRAEIEEVGFRIREAYEAKEEFEGDVVTKGVDLITGKVPAEKVTRFIEEWLRSANTIIERLRLKSATLRIQIKKAKQQLVQREQLGETLHAVDFEQLNIQNRDYAKILEEKNRYVIEMKRIAGHYHLKLTQHKQKLSDLSLKLNALKKEIIVKKEQIQQLTAEHDIIEVEMISAEEQLMQLLDFMENHTAPDILDFVKLQTEFNELQRTYKLLQRRRNIEQIILKSYQKQFLVKSRISEEIRGQKKLKLKLDTIYPVSMTF